MVDKSAFELLKKTVAEMDSINSAIQDSYSMSPERVLEPVLGDIEFDELGPITQAKLTDLVTNYLMHIRAALENEMNDKALDIQQLK